MGQGKCGLTKISSGSKRSRGFLVSCGRNCCVFALTGGQWLKPVFAITVALEDEMSLIESSALPLSGRAVRIGRIHVDETAASACYALPLCG